MIRIGSYRYADFVRRKPCCEVAHSRLLRALWLLFVIVFLFLQHPHQAGAIEQIELDLGSLSGEGWRAEQVRFTLDWGDQETAYVLQIAKLQLSALEREFSAVEIACERGRIGTESISCEAGRLTLPDPLLQRATMPMSFEFDRLNGRLTGRLRRIALAGGSIDLKFQLDAEDWQLEAKGRTLQLQTLLTHWPQLRKHQADWSLTGSVDLDMRLTGDRERLRHARWKGRVSELSLGDTEGLYAGEGVALDASGELEPAKGGWRIDSTLALTEGEVLTPQFYLDAAARPLKLQGVVDLDAKFRALSLRDASLTQAGLLQLSLKQGLWNFERQSIERLKLRLAPLAAGDLYREMLQPVLAGSPWGSFEVDGEVDLSLDLEHEAVSLNLGLKGFSIDDEQDAETLQRLGLYDLNGRLFWRSAGSVETSRLGWGGGHLLRHIELGPGEVEFLASANSLELTRQARLPVLDGALVVDRLALQALGSDAQRLEFDGLIEPISMASLSQALGWLPLSGKLSGMLPGLKYEQGLLSVDGVILVRIFDGDILIKQLQTQDLFGVYPQLSADVELHGLDLESLTRTFSFGRITGRLDGYMRELKLEQWSPVSFDARFYTPEDDRSRRRISQKAVDNISNLGGAGMSGALARSFMRFFEEFGYKRIGIGCRLHDGVCQMAGAGPAKQGYYLVQGSGIPRIDIIGFNTTADWNSLVEQLKQIATSGAPTVQ